jgi:replicative DNA helicase
MIETRELPKDLVAEQAILGGILLNPTSIATARKILSPDDFYSTPHQLIARAMWSIDGPVDLVRLIGQLQAKGDLEEASGEAYIVGLLESVGTAAGDAPLLRGGQGNGRQAAHDQSYHADKPELL